MGQKVNPHGLRVGVIKDWDSRWFAKDEVFGDTLVSDYNLRHYLKKTLGEAGVPKIEIERFGDTVRVFIHCAKPGLIIGHGGEQITKLKAKIEEMTGKSVILNVVEVKNPDLNAQLIAENVAGQLERRITFRRAMKQSIGRTMRLGAKGIKIACSGRLGGAEIARSEHYHEGTIPLQTIRADIDYGFAEANTTYGKIGVKVWLYNGEVLADAKSTGKRRNTNDRGDRRGDRKPRGERRDNRGGNSRNNNRGNGRGFNKGGEREVRNFSNRNPAFRRPAKAVEAPAAETAEGGNE